MSAEAQFSDIEWVCCPSLSWRVRAADLRAGAAGNSLSPASERNHLDRHQLLVEHGLLAFASSEHYRPAE